ncbi:unnamed protein product [Pleuronectes platessa]|uniref:Uncharacterized protein n=1 Tax=Pleuronectes platessa TaxID=8262 RepID=A0A9N7YN43_PLEPL|nr:unnamed protein product [Pleuronectes platessa]
MVCRKREQRRSRVFKGIDSQTSRREELQLQLGLTAGEISEGYGHIEWRHGGFEMVGLREGLSPGQPCFLQKVAAGREPRWPAASSTPKPVYAPTIEYLQGFTR